MNENRNQSHGCVEMLLLGCLGGLLYASQAVAVPHAVDLSSPSSWDIVVSNDAIESERYAAKEFQHHFFKASGFELPVTTDPQGTAHHVYIGPSLAHRESQVRFSVDDCGPEDLRIVVRDGNIAIAGGRPRGTLYGVYTFLEDYLGVRFLTPEHTHVPLLDPQREIPPTDHFYHPPMDFRWVAYEANYAKPDFCARRRLNAARVSASPVGDTEGRGVGKYGGRTPMRLTNHSFNRQLPPAKYAQDHPEYFCLFRGKRLAVLPPGTSGTDFKSGKFPYGMQPCMTHPDVLQIITQSVLDEIANKPNVLNISVSQNDGNAHCECDQCAAINEREHTKGGALLTLVNAVADTVAKEYPDRMIGTLAYSDTAPPPKTLHPRENVQVWWCSIGTCFVHPFDDKTCTQNRWFIDQLRQWSRLTGNLYAWNYYMNDERQSYQLPLPNLQLIDDNVRFQISLGVRGMFMHATSSSHGNEFEDLRNYLLSKLLWDPSLDGDRLISEWLDLHYGPAAPPIAQWIARLHNRSVTSGKHCRCLGGKYEDYGLDDTDVQAGLDAFDQAGQLAGHDAAIQMRVEKASIAAYRAALEPVWYLKEGEVDPALAQRMRPVAKHFFELCEKHGVTRTHEVGANKIGDSEKKLQKTLGSWDAS